MADPVSDQKAALGGVLNAQMEALRASAQDVMESHIVSVSNDAIEATANLVSQLSETLFMSGGKTQVLNAIRGLKR